MITKEIFESKIESGDTPVIFVGDDIKFSYKLFDGAKIKFQPVSGRVIAIKGEGIQKSFSILRTLAGTQIEQSFLLQSPNILQLKRMSAHRIRKSKLYYLRGLVGKKAKLRKIKF